MPNSISRASLLDLLNGRRQADIPAFSGLLHVTAAGLAREGLAWREVHRDAGKMARAAANTFKLTGLPSVTLPLDFTAPAEMLGAELVFYAEDEFQFPQVKRPLVESAREIAKMESGAAGCRSSWRRSASQKKTSAAQPSFRDCSPGRTLCCFTCVTRRNYLPR